MNVAKSLDQFGLVPSDEALPRIRELLALEAEAERAGHDREDDLALLCCVQLFSRGYLDDCLRIWDAKSSGFDLGCYLDVKLLCGAGLEQTKIFLENQRSSEAQAALAYIEDCERSESFVDFSPAGYLSEFERYFRR